MYFIPWSLGQNACAEGHSIYYYSGSWVFCISPPEEDSEQTDEAADAGDRFSPFGLHLGNYKTIKQIAVVEGGSAVVILDTAGSISLWWPFGRVIETRPEIRNTSFDEARQSGRATTLTLALPVSKIVASQGQFFALEHELRLYTSLWRTDHPKGVYLEDVKENGIAVSNCHDWVAVLTRRGCVDSVVVFEVLPAPASVPATQRCPQLKAINTWSVPKTSKSQWCGDIKRIRWAPRQMNDNYIALLDTYLSYCVYIYRVADGKLVRALVRRRHKPIALAGPGEPTIDLSSIEEPLFSSDLTDQVEEGLGAKLMEWCCIKPVEGNGDEETTSSNEAMLSVVVGDHANKVRVFSDSNLFASPLTLLQHHSLVTNQSQDELLYFREALSPAQPGETPTSHYEVASLPYNTSLRLPTAPFSQPCGIQLMSPSPSGHYLASVSEATPNHIWIWDLSPSVNRGIGFSVSPRLAFVLENFKPIVEMMWAPDRDVLAISTGSQSIYFWKTEGAAAVAVPAPPEFAIGNQSPVKVQRIKWTSSSLILIQSPATTIKTDPTPSGTTGTSTLPATFCLCALEGEF